MTRRRLEMTEKKERTVEDQYGRGEESQSRIKI